MSFDRTPGRRRGTVIVAGLVLAMVMGGVAYAAHSFTDVPDDHTFHGDIEWMKDSGITRGCNPPANTEYCPDDFTTRGEMAAFFHRFSVAGIVDADTLDGLDSTEFVRVGGGAGTGDGDGDDGVVDTSHFLGSAIEIRTATLDVGTTFDSETVSCLEGEQVISGGYDASTTSALNVTQNHPAGNGWTVGATASVPGSLTVYALCSAVG